MKLNYKLILLSSLLSVAAFFIMLNTFLKTPEQNKKVMSVDFAYTITEYNDKIAIIDTKTNKPYMILDVIFDELPERDKTKLKQGIYTKTLEQALSLAEDYE